ncbi:MAG TPA: nicotinate-nucleotide--dimethylbenzimidazole phosphoribosyltransferase [Firmicutes bacterium]|nr:nicotinate-nucleotide--dimethylbenzimidazole phosphoribosyltransferase [Bacillota bacterium]
MKHGEFIKNVIDAIGELDSAAMKKAAARQDSLTKPQGSLGVLEEIAIKLAGISGEVFPNLDDKCVIVIAADHGVTRHGVSAYPSEVTAQMVANFMRGGAAINVLARYAGARVHVVDVGVASPIPPISGTSFTSVRVRPGTADISEGPAMSRDEAEAALAAGITVAQREISSGAKVLATGDMGIGNTTASAAVFCALTGIPPIEVVGPGTGLEAEKIAHKIAIVEKALTVNRPDCRDPVDVLSRVGGLEIAGIAGVILGAAAARTPVVIDGFISGAGAVAAYRLNPKVRNFMFASHLSEEKGHRLMLQAMGLKPMLHMNMRLGEGTGACLAFLLLEAACRIQREMATFEEASISGRSAQ